MAIKPEVLDALLAAGATAEMIVAAVKADQAADHDRTEAKREGNAARQRRFKARRRADAEVTEGNDGNALPELPGVIGEESPLPSPPLPSPKPPTNTPTPIPPVNKHHAREATRLPADWEPEPLTGLSADCADGWPPGALDRELERFRNWAASASGKNGRKKDWQAAWRNWVLRADDEGRHEQRTTNFRGGQPAGRDKRDGLATVLDRRIAEAERREAAEAAGRRDFGDGDGFGFLPPPAPPCMP